MHQPSLLAAIPDIRSDRWRLLCDILAAWYRTITKLDGISEAELNAAEQRLGIKIPSALREWYMLAGR
jgi:hypothetical protein